MLLEDLRSFVVLAESCDEHRAARGLNVSPATLRRSMARLEQRFGGQLIRREPDGLSLTSLGDQVLEKALDVLEAAADLLHAIHRPIHRPFVVVGSLYRMLVDEIGDAVSAVDTVASGDYSVEFRETGDDDPTGGLARGRVDAAVLAGPTDLDGVLVRRAVAQVPRVAMLPVHHRLASRSGVEVRQLDADAWVDDIGIPDASWPAYWRCEDVRGEAPDRRVPVTGVDQLVEAVRVGAGVAVRPAVLPTLLAAPGIVSVPLVDAPPCTVDLAYRQDALAGPYVDALADRVSAVLDARPVGIRIRASSVVSGVVVTGLTTRPAIEDDGAHRRQRGLRRRLRAIGGGSRVIDLTGSEGRAAGVGGLDHAER